MKQNSLVLIALIILSLACSNKQQNQEEVGSNSTNSINTKTKQQKKEMKRILFFGNSLTAGYGLEESESFPSLIQDSIVRLQLPYKVVNAGLSGETSSGGLQRIEWVLNQQVDIFVLELGANDALRGLDLKDTKKNLQGIIDQVRIKFPAIPIIIAGMEAPPNLGKTYTEAFKSIFKELASKNQTLLLPFLLDGVGGRPELNLADGIHPNAIGQKIVRDNMWKVLAPLLN